MTTRIYINDGNSHKVVQLTNLLTSAMVIQYLRKKSLLDASEDWTLFEIDIVHNVERPLREWEVVMDVLNVWDVDASNALLVKKYAYHYTLTADVSKKKKTIVFTMYTYKHMLEYPSEKDQSNAQLGIYRI